MYNSTSLAINQCDTSHASQPVNSLHSYCKSKSIENKLSKVFLSSNNLTKGKLVESNVLFITSHNKNRYLLKTILGNAYSLTSIDDPIIGLACFIRSLHKFVVIDIRNLKLDSYDIIKEIRRLSVVNKIYSKIIIIYSEENQVYKALKHENLADFYIKEENKWHEKLFYLHIKKHQKYFVIK